MGSTCPQLGPLMVMVSEPCGEIAHQNTECLPEQCSQFDINTGIILAFVDDLCLTMPATYTMHYPSTDVGQHYVEDVVKTLHRV